MPYNLYPFTSSRVPAPLTLKYSWDAIQRDSHEVNVLDPVPTEGSNKIANDFKQEQQVFSNSQDQTPKVLLCAGEGRNGRGGQYLPLLPFIYLLKQQVSSFEVLFR